MIIRLKEGERERERKNWMLEHEQQTETDTASSSLSVFPEWDISYLYLREASQRATSPDCSWHPLLQGYVVVNSGLKKGSMCEWRCYERVLKNWDYFTQNMKARDSPFTTNSSLTFSHPNLKWSNTALQLLLKMFQRVTKCSKSSLLFYGDRHKTNHSMMRCLLHFFGST